MKQRPVGRQKGGDKLDELMKEGEVKIDGDGG